MTTGSCTLVSTKRSMRLRAFLFAVAGIPLVGGSAIGAVLISPMTTMTASSDQKTNDAPVGSAKNPLRVSSGIMMGYLIHYELPHYPALV